MIKIGVGRALKLIRIVNIVFEFLCCARFAWILTIESLTLLTCIHIPNRNLSHHFWITCHSCTTFSYLRWFGQSGYVVLTKLNRKNDELSSRSAGNCQGVKPNCFDTVMDVGTYTSRWDKWILLETFLQLYKLTKIGLYSSFQSFYMVKNGIQKL